MVFAGDHVGEGAVAFKLGESDENGFGLGVASGSNDAAEADEGVASPVEKPGIAGDDGLELFALHDEGFDGALKHVFKGLKLGSLRVRGLKVGVALTLASRVAGGIEHGYIEIAGAI